MYCKYCSAVVRAKIYHSLYCTKMCQMMSFLYLRRGQGKNGHNNRRTVLSAGLVQLDIFSGVAEVPGFRGVHSLSNETIEQVAKLNHLSPVNVITRKHS